MEEYEMAGCLADTRDIEPIPMEEFELRGDDDGPPIVLASAQDPCVPITSDDIFQYNWSHDPNPRSSPNPVLYCPSVFMD